MRMPEERSLLLLRTLLVESGLEGAPQWLLEQVAPTSESEDERNWLISFIKVDEETWQKRGEEELKRMTTLLSVDQRLRCLQACWMRPIEKGYLTVLEMELLLRTAQCWCVDKKFLNYVGT